MESNKNNLCDCCMFACEHKAILGLSAGNVHPHKLFLTKYEWVAKRGLLNIYQIKSSQISFGETNIIYKKSCSLRVIMRKTKSMNIRISMVVVPCNFLMKLILWVNFDVTGNQYEQKSILSHSDDGTFKTLQKYFECCKKIPRKYW